MTRVLSQIVLLCIISAIFSFSQAQKRYWIFFTDKDNVEFDPYSHFDERTIQKRINTGLSLIDFSDLPVRDDYIEELKSYVKRSRAAVS